MKNEKLLNFLDDMFVCLLVIGECRRWGDIGEFVWKYDRIDEDVEGIRSKGEKRY